MVAFHAQHKAGHPFVGATRLQLGILYVALTTLRAFIRIAVLFLNTDTFLFSNGAKVLDGFVYNAIPLYE